LKPRAREIAEQVRRRERSARQVCEAAFGIIDACNPELNAIVQMDRKRSLAEADEVDLRTSRDERLPLAGVPYTLKDNLWAAGWRVSQGARAFADFIAPRDAWSVKRFRQAGAVLVGITNCSEFACKGVTDNPLYGVTRNPWDLRLTPGGSSGGAAAATAAGMAPLALCTDAGGSTRRPAAHTGLVGMKPSLGLVPYLPHSFAEPNLGISVIGVMAHDVDDAALALECLAGYSPEDPYSVAAEFRLQEDTADLRVAWSPDLGCGFPIDADVLEVMEALVARLAVQARAAPDWPAGTGEYPLAAMQEAGLAAFYGNAAADPDVVALIEAGRRRTGAEIAECVLKREALAASLARFFERFDLLLAPTAPVTAWPIPHLGPTHIGGKPVGPRAHAAFTPLFNYCGVPACSVPAGLVRGLPVGIQVIGPRFRDGVVLRYARYVESFVRAMTATGPPPGGP